MNAAGATSPSLHAAPRGRALAACLGLLLAACDEPVRSLSRAGRFGSLRDLVLFERNDVGGAAALFFDRFEVTRGDWASFVETPAGRAVEADAAAWQGDPTLPVAFVDLRQARAFARWRCLRLPRVDEWQFVTVGDRRNAFPWGSKVDPTRANTAELGLGQPTPVGTFESGRRAGSDQPYDLVGNVSEWTESVPSSWWEERGALDGQPAVLDPVSGLRVCRQRVLATPALAAWQGCGGLLPTAWLLAAGGGQVPREVVGADFQTPMADGLLVEAVAAGDRRSRTGIRLCATAAELLVALGREALPLSSVDEAQVRRFVRRGVHREVLLEAWAALEAAGHVFTAGPITDVLRQELGFAPNAGG